MQRPRFHCLAVAAFLTVSPYTPQHFLSLAKEEISVGDKIALLRRLIQSFPLDASAKVAHQQLVALLAGSNRIEEALQEYQLYNAAPGAGDAIDFTLLDYWLKTGRYHDVLRATAAASGPTHNLLRDERLLELQVQAWLALGQYGIAGQCVDQWLERYQADGSPGTRFETDVRSIQFLRRHLSVLERLDGSQGRPFFTASVPDSLQHWSHRRNVPIVFFKLIPAHPGASFPLRPWREAMSLRLIFKRRWTK